MGAIQTHLSSAEQAALADAVDLLKRLTQP
jgi:hypothetical protein